MRVEHYRTQARLLASTAPDGQRAQALDTKNKFEYSVAYGGWVPLVPVDGFEGEPLVAVEDRGISAFDTTARLIPTGGTAGELPVLDQFSAPTMRGFSSGDADVFATNIAGTTTTIHTASLPGGCLGPNGFIRAFVAMDATTGGSAATATLSLTDSTPTTIATVTTGTMAAGFDYNIEFYLTWKNQASQGGQWIWFRAYTLRTTGSSIETNQITSTDKRGVAGFDIANDFTLLLRGGSTANSTVTRAIIVEYAYIA